jgi:hypothetical protein
MPFPDSAQRFGSLHDHASSQARETVSSSPEIDQGEGSSGTVFILSLARPKRLSYFLAACYHSRERNDRIAALGLDKLPGQNNAA